MDVQTYFQLNEPPFRISPDPRFLFLSDQVKEALAKVQYMTRERIGPLYMSGPIGSGKTSIMRRLYQQLHEEPNYNIVLIIAPNVKTSNAFLRMVMDGFGVKTDRAYARCLKNFEDFLIEQYKANIVPMLLVDEGQNMTRDILRLVHYLLNFETSSVKLLQIVLAGQEQLTEKILRYPELASRMFPIAMNAMSATELRAMIEFRYMVAGGKHVPFTDEAYKEIFIYSKGLPRDAVKICDETLRHLFVRERKEASADDSIEVATTLNLKK
jgi:general secretion pathway protein A